MRKNRISAIIGLMIFVVAVSVATNVVMQKKQRNQQDNEGFNFNQVPAGYAAFKNASRAGETDFTVAAAVTVDAVVHVKVKQQVKQQSFGFGGNDPIFEYFFGPQMRPQQPQIVEGAGSGVIISNDGYIVTNNHVVDDTKEIEVVLNNKRTYSAKVIGADPNTDIALLKIDENDLPTVIFGNSDSLKIGEWVLAVGNPFNLTSTVTAGIVSAKARSINILNGPMKIESFIQTDAAVNPGNSGGALVNTRGELVGINTAIASQTGSYAGYSFAVPSSIVQKVVTDLRKYGYVQRAVLGVQIKEIDAALAKDKNLKDLEGAYVDKVESNSAAENAGIKSGDVITHVNGVKIKTVAELQEQIGRYRPGDKISVELTRDNKELKFNVDLKNRMGNTELVSSDFDVSMLGASFKPADKNILEKFGIDYGVEVKAVSKGKFADAGIKSGYIILKINNIRMSNEKDIETALKATMDNADSNKVLFITGFYPNGKTAYYAVDLTNK
jgi:Do/DeqQ family serine protease